MLELAVVAVVCAAFGFTAWGVDPHRRSYGVLLSPASALVTGLLAWIIVSATALSFTPGLAWLTWALPMAVGLAASIGTHLVAGARRARRDTEKLNAILRG